MDGQLQTVLNMLPQPAFLLGDGQILWCNAMATALRLQELPPETIFGQELSLLRAKEPGGGIQLAISLGGQPYAATIQPLEAQLLVIASPIVAPIAAESSLPFSDALRRPLQELMSAAGTLFEELPEARSSRMTGAAAEVNRAIYRIQKLCTHASESGRLLSEDPTIQRRSRSISDLLEDFAASCQPLVSAAGYDFHYTPSPLTLVADIDGQLLERALYQLLANAMAYTPKGGRIRLSCEKQDHLLLIHMEDSGEGFRPEILAGLYAGARRSPSADPRSGIGMGLPVVKRIAELHGGNLTIQSSGSGTISTLSLSLAHAPLSLRSVLYHSDLYGGHNAALVELSEVLPASLYDPEEIES